MTCSKLLLILVAFAAGGGLLARACYGQSPSSAKGRGVVEGKVLPAIDEIQGDRVFTVLPKDAIPAIDNPRFVTADRGSTWSWERGECLQGPFQGKHLRRIVGLPVYWAIWARFHPGTEVIGPEHPKFRNK